MGSIHRHLPDVLLVAITLLMHLGFYLAARTEQRFSGSRRNRLLLCGALAVSGAYVSLSMFFSLNRFASLLPAREWLYWLRGMGYLWALASFAAFAVLMLLKRVPGRFSPERRRFLNVAQGAALASPAVIIGYGVLGERKQFEVKEVDIAIPGLAKDLHGVRILQLSDIHMSPFLTEKDLARVIGMANETKPNLCVVTGDLITGKHDPLDLCMRQVAKVKSDAGIVCCNGNHEIFARAEAHTKEYGARLGMNFLRHEKTTLRFGNAKMNIAGVDYQRFHAPYLVGMETLVEPDAFNLLLSHNPDVFPVAAKQGYQLTLAGHTHGGQITVEILEQYANVARFFTPYVYGRYEKGGASIYVTRGIGTVGVPARIGATPEITVVRLCAS
ncbi:MAG: metallophosphoesterase [Bryobacterales bacterium]|nr:metallophosphoesterase [Bryobacterales bacterium]